MIDPMALNRTVFLAIQDVYIVGIFTTENAAKEACQAHYNHYATLKPALPAVTLEWGYFRLVDGTPYISTPDMGGQAIYRIQSFPLNVNLRLKARV